MRRQVDNAKVLGMANQRRRIDVLLVDREFRINVPEDKRMKYHVHLVEGGRNFITTCEYILIAE
ncbi:MAG: hypothetical protein JSV27_01685 [Candidatus Bathyarchaeota archaeon]|nr:MAG: hypothetical protein JSV27_01685 [Candidatus Bathyarchaeota archaeon]